MTTAACLSRTIFARWRARPEDQPLGLLLDGGREALTGARLLELARGYAAGLAAHGVGPGDRVGLVLGTSEAFLGAFFGAWWLGAVPMPLAPPRGPEDREILRVGRALAIAEARLAVVPDDAPLPPVSPCPLVPASALRAAPGDHEPAEQELALIQFSSGSTGHPKGVALTHAALRANLDGLRAGIGCGPTDVGVAWLPLHHDMGLIGCLLFPLHVGFTATLMPPEAFVRQPVRWIRALGELGATITTGPCFGYALAAKLPPSATEGLDLSRLRAALVGAEPVREPVLSAFAARYAAHGFSPRAWVPTYGLAEATLAVTLTPPGEGLTLEPLGETGLALVATGPPLPGVRVTIHDEAGAELPERVEGEIRVASPSLMRAYWADPVATREAFDEAGRLRTGDLGYMAAGRLVVSGRLKDLIIRAGRKWHAADLEAIAEADPAVRPGGCAAFAVTAADGDERVVLLVEARPGADAELAARLRRRVHELVGLRLDEVVALAPRALPKTTSGKIQRREARRRWLAGELARAHG